MTDMQAALGLSQLQRLDDFVTRRHEIAKHYDEYLTDMPIVIPWQQPESYSAWHLYVVRLELERIQKTHREAFAELRAAGIGVNLHYIPVYHQPYYQGLGFNPGYCPEAENYYAEAISLPLYPGLSLDQQDRVVSAMREVVGA